MVVAIGISMMSLSDSIDQTTADVEMNKILTEIKEIILQEMSTGFYNASFTYTIELDIPEVLSHRYPYEIGVTNDSAGFYQLYGTSETLSTSFEVNEPLLLSKNDFTVTGTIKSSLSYPSILIQKTSETNNKISISLENYAL
jgi:hypothetical protein